MVKSSGSGGGAAASDECPVDNLADNSAIDINGPYEWSSFQQGLVVSIYFAGYLIGMFPAGYFADRSVNCGCFLEI